MAIFRAADIQDDLRLKADVVVVGSGAGGAVAAYHLAAGGKDVVLLEKGPYFVTSDFKSDPHWSMQNLYAEKGLTASLGVPPVLIPFGECVGGTTVINSGTVFRIPDRVLAVWQMEHGVEEARAKDLAGYYADVEEKIGAAEAEWPALGELNRVIERGVNSLGLSGGPLVRNAPNCAGCGMCVFGCPAGAKRSMLVSYVPAADAKGCRIYSEVAVDEIRTRNGRVEGVSGRVTPHPGRKPGARVRVDAPIVIIAAGTFATPLLLDANGLAGKSGELGQNLKIHPAGGAVARMPTEVDGWRAIPQGYHVNEWEEEGIMLEGGFGPPEVLSLMVPGVGNVFRERMEDYRRFASFGIMVADRDSVGSVHRVGSRRVIRYQLGHDDRRRFVYGLKQVIRILLAAGADEVYPAVHGHAVVKDEAGVKKIDERHTPGDALTLSAYHPMGTARMGGSPETAVVNSYGESFDTGGLFVADASVFPTSLGVNPQASIMAFAARTADHILRKMS